jgi:hypothetical protein
VVLLAAQKERERKWSLNLKSLLGFFFYFYVFCCLVSFFFFFFFCRSLTSPAECWLALFIVYREIRRYITAFLFNDVFVLVKVGCWFYYSTVFWARWFWR